MFYFVEEWETVHNLIHTKSVKDIANKLHRSEKLVNNYAKMSEEEIESKSRLFSRKRPRNIKPTITFPDLFVTSDGQFVFKFKKYWYTKPTIITTWSRGIKSQVSVYWNGDYHRAHRLVAEAWLEDFKTKRYVHFIDGNKLNIAPSNLEMSDNLNPFECERCGKGIKKPPLCEACADKIRRASSKKTNIAKLAYQIENGVELRHKQLTPAQKQVLDKLKQGDSVTNIAKSLNITKQAVSSTIKSLKKKANMI